MECRVSQAVWNDLIVTWAVPALANPKRNWVIVPLGFRGVESMSCLSGCGFFRHRIRRLIARSNCCQGQSVAYRDHGNKKDNKTLGQRPARRIA